jgi:outer membrane protein
LDAAQKIALRNHPQIAAADYRALAAQEAAKETRAGYFPNASLFVDAVGADNSGKRLEVGGLNNPSIYDRAAGGVTVSQLLYDFGHTKNLAASSRLQAEAENQNANATREQILLSVNVNYYHALAAQAVEHVAQQTFDTRQILLDKISLLASNQIKSELDVSFARVAVQEGKLLLQQAQNNSAAALTSLSTALGYHEVESFRLMEPVAAAPDNASNDSQLVELALAQRPELLSLRDKGDAAHRFARSERDSRLPTISAIGQAGGSPIHDNQLSDTYAAGGLQLSLPLFAGGLYTARQHEAELKAQADEEVLRNAENDVVRDVHLAWLSVNDAQEQLQTTHELVSNAAEAYELANARYKIGSSSIVELSQAQLSLTSAQITEANARYDLLIQQANLNYQTGALR